ncbi:MAG TPA: type II toxin-antitoxin system MqsR family toxin [Opitutaceae bacterium]|nr:type II toxin-antitoxin system MqsR family toxin [Opitutaceae bacterium]
MEKRRCSHDLAAIKAAFSSAALLRRTKTSARDAAALGMDSEAVVAVIQALVYPRDFEKSATAHHDPRQWHDSYKPVVGRRSLYLKFTLDETGAFLLTSFKEA